MKRHGQTARSVIEALGVRLVAHAGLDWTIRPSDRDGFAWAPSTGDEIGDPPTGRAALVRLVGEVVVVVGGDLGPTTMAAALHEALHAVLGERTFDTEQGMMQVEWAVARTLASPWWDAWRDSFCDYGLGWVHGDIGRGNAFLLSREWADGVVEAQDLGWLDAKRRPTIWGAGVHPTIAAWTHETGAPR